MEILIQLIAVLLALLFATIKSMNFAPSAFSDFELNRLAKSGDSAADYELQRRNYLRLFVAIKHIKEITIAVLLTSLLVATHQPVIGLVVAIAYLLLAQVVAASGWLNKWSDRLQHRFEPLVAHWVGRFAGVIHFFAPKSYDSSLKIASRAELVQLLDTDSSLLEPKEKERLLNALNFDDLKVKDAMVKAGKIATVDISETVGPLLLDRLHKAGHNIFVVVKKDIDHVKGLLYMRDLVPLDPDLKDVKDAIRSTVHYVLETATLEQVIAAGLQTGRQLFIVVDDKGKTVGLINLGDALSKLLGSLPPLNKSMVVTDPKKVKSDENSK